MRPDATEIAILLGLGASVVITVAMVVCVVLGERRTSRVGREILIRWDQANGRQFLSLQRRYFRRGPFWWRAGNAVVFRGKVRTASGEWQAGYFRVGTFFLGLMSDQVSVEWD